MKVRQRGVDCGLRLGENVFMSILHKENIYIFVGVESALNLFNYLLKEGKCSPKYLREILPTFHYSRIDSLIYLYTNEV